MSVVRPVVSVYGTSDPPKAKGTLLMPTVMQSPIRPDLVNFVHYNLLRNHRQAYGVKENAGYQTSAESWGTGRAVARIPRVPGGGTHRAGQGAFGNMCRGGGMFNPNKTWRRWHRKVNVTQRRHALASAIASCSSTGLVMGRGHKISDIPELPLVVSSDVEKFEKTKEALNLLKHLAKLVMRIADILDELLSCHSYSDTGQNIPIDILSRFAGDLHCATTGCDKELERVSDSKKIRAGRGKSRNRRYVLRKGPLIVYSQDNGIVRAFANIPGVDTCCVTRLNLLKVAPGGVLGRLVIWTEDAFKQLQDVYGNYSEGSKIKSEYILNRPMMTNADLSRIINSNEIQSALRDAIEPLPRSRANKNPLKNYAVMCRLNPAFKSLKRKRRRMVTYGTPMYKLIQKEKTERATATKNYRKRCGPMTKLLAKLGEQK